MALNLLSLPPEILSLILMHCGTLHEIALLRSVCKEFEALCSNILRLNFMNLKSRVSNQTQRLKEKTEDLIEQSTKNCNKMRNDLMANRTTHLHQMNLLDSVLNIVYACTWSYISAGIASVFFGSLLDTYQRILDDLLSDQSLPTAKDIYHMQIITLKMLKFFHNICKERLNKISTGNKVVLPCLTFIAVLEACYDNKRTASLLLNVERKNLSNSQNIVQLQASYNLGCCVLGIQNSMRAQNSLKKSDILMLCEVVRDLVWLTNNEYLESEWQKLDRNFGFIWTTGPFGCPIQILKRIDVGNTSVHYGIGKYIRSWQNLNHPAPPLLFHVDVTCDVSLLPPSLLRSTPIKLPNDNESSLLEKNSLFKLKVVIESVDWPEYPPVLNIYEYNSE